MEPCSGQRHISLVASPDVMVATLAGLYDVFNCFGALAWFDTRLAQCPPFTVDVVATKKGLLQTATGLTVAAQRCLGEIHETDIVIVPSTLVPNGEWQIGQHREIVDWLSAVHESGAQLCSACSGTLLMAETGLLDGRTATMHWAYAETFRRNFPAVDLHLEKALLVEGEHGEFLMSGAASSWNDLALYLIARHLGDAVAQAVAKFFAFQWHTEGLGPYAVFQPRHDHEDAAILRTQQWIEWHIDAPNPVDEMMHRSGLSERSFKRRFREATGYTPIRYVQALRVEDAKRALEGSKAPIDEISWRVGYREPAFFRRLFRRTTGITPSSYRQKFRLPDL